MANNACWLIDGVMGKFGVKVSSGVGDFGG